MKTDNKKEKKARRARIDSIDEHVRIVQHAKRTISPPEHMTVDDKTLIYFDEIIAEKPKAEWTSHQITLATMLARMMMELDVNQERMIKEGSLIKDAGGAVKMNPRRKLITDYVDKVATLRRSLGIYAMASGSEKFQIFKKNFMGKGIEADILSNDDDLIATPTMVN